MYIWGHAMLASNDQDDEQAEDNFHDELKLGIFSIKRMDEKAKSYQGTNGRIFFNINPETP